MRSSEALPGDRGGQEGNTLLLMPFAVLVLLVLGSIALDAAVVFQADREAADVAASLANDAVALIDRETFAGVGEGEIGITVLDRSAIAGLAATETAARADGRLQLRCAASYPAGPQVVEVSCEGSVQPIIAPAVGGRGRRAIGATTRAVAAGS